MSEPTYLSLPDIGYNGERGQFDPSKPTKRKPGPPKGTPNLSAKGKPNPNGGRKPVLTDDQKANKAVTLHLTADEKEAWKASGLTARAALCLGVDIHNQREVFKIPSFMDTAPPWAGRGGT